MVFISVIWAVWLLSYQEGWRGLFRLTSTSSTWSSISALWLMMAMKSSSVPLLQQSTALFSLLHSQQWSNVGAKGPSLPLAGVLQVCTCFSTLQQTPCLNVGSADVIAVIEWFSLCSDMTRLSLWHSPIDSCIAVYWWLQCSNAQLTPTLSSLKPQTCFD